ncbi:hypothetical protein [Paludibacterium paludis]|uniref:Uncharacterized protein n=1 Tax=Paludibacterium paludis TaxID=1225769 RepID=A0A918P6W2_9NEIS|nr:hypothetical protein [Paludibacterium paludis]GGY24314.1 hypothetical protein GCM10011289_30070 [Paludibacterium paludis]
MTPITSSGPRTLRHSASAPEAQSAGGLASQLDKAGLTSARPTPPLRRAHTLNHIHRIAKTHAQEHGRIEEQVAKSFVAREHLDAIATATRQGHFAITFREAGAATLACLARGAAAKGHDILEKTIKPASLKSAYGEASDAHLATIRKAGIEGYVGHWSKENGLCGMYLSPEVAAWAHAADPVLRAAHAGLIRKEQHGETHYIYPLDIHRLDASLHTLKSIANWETLPFTGDYDTHDIISFSGAGKPHVPPSGSNEEQFVVNAVNQAVAAVDPARPFDKVSHNVVRHGPQVSYAAHMMDHEKGAPLIKDVANPSFPLAVCDRGTWSIISTREELSELYKGAGGNLKSTWQEDGGAHFAPVEQGRAAHVRFQRGSRTSQ